MVVISDKSHAEHYRDRVARSDVMPAQCAEKNGAHPDCSLYAANSFAPRYANWFIRWLRKLSD